MQQGTLRTQGPPGRLPDPSATLLAAASGCGDSGSSAGESGQRASLGLLLKAAPAASNQSPRPAAALGRTRGLAMIKLFSSD